MHAVLPLELLAGPLAAYLETIEDAKVMVIGESAAQVYRLSVKGAPVSYLKFCPRAAGLTLADDAARLRWLGPQLPVPRLLAYYEDESHTYLLISAIPGIDAATLAVDEVMDMAMLVTQLAHGLRQIHETPLAGCPFNHSLAHELPRAQERTAQRLVDESNFDEERQGRSAASLLAELLAAVPATEELVLTHGDYCLPNILLLENQISGFIDLGLAGVGDRYRDLALARRSLIRNCGPEWVDHFFIAYGLPHPDEEKLAFYQLLDEFN